MRGRSGRRNRVNESRTLEESPVERRCEHARGLVIDGPPGGHHATHPGFDQRLCHTGCKLRAIVVARFEQQALVRARKVTAIDEYELGNDPQGANLRRSEIRIVRENNAARQESPARLERGFTVAGDVDDSPRTAHRRIQDGVRIRLQATVVLRADEGRHKRTGVVLSETPAKALGDGHRFSACAEEPRVTFPVACGIADDKHAVVGGRVVDRAGPPIGPQLTKQLRTNRPWTCVTAPRGNGIEKLPRDCGSAAVELDNGRRAAPHEGLEVDRHEQAEERAANLLIRIRAVRSGRHQISDERQLRGLCADFAARAFRVDRIDDLLLLVFALVHESTDEIVLRSAISPVGRTTQRADPIFDDRTHAVDRGEDVASS